jgi:hypothetical protein
MEWYVLVGLIITLIIITTLLYYKVYKEISPIIPLDIPLPGILVKTRTSSQIRRCKAKKVTFLL